MTFWVLFWVSVSCLGYILFSIKGWQKIKTLKHFFLHDGKLKPPGFWGTMVATNAAVANGFFLYILLGYYKGWGAFFWSSVFWLAGIVVFELLGRRLGPHFSQLVTLNEFLGEKAPERKSAVRGVVAFVTIISFLLTLCTEMVVGSQIFFTLLFPDGVLNKFLAIVIPTLLVIPVAVYLAAGGFPAVVRSDWAQVICFIPGLVVCGIAACSAGVTEWKNTSVSDFFGLSDWTFIVFSLYSWSIWFLVAMDMWQRCAATGSTTAQRKPTWLSLLFLIPFTAIAVGCGIYARQSGLEANGKPISQVFMELLVWHSNLSTTSIVLVFVALVAAILSTVDTFLMVVAHSLFADILLPARDMDVKTNIDPVVEQRLLFKARVLLILLPLLCVFGFAFVIYIANANVLAMNYISYSIPCSFVPLVLLALFRRRIESIPTILAVVAGVMSIGFFCIPKAIEIANGVEIAQNYKWLYATPFVASFASASMYFIAVTLGKLSPKKTELPS